MMTTPSPDTAASPPENLFDAIAQLLGPGHREYFYQRMLYFRHLRPEDELLRIVEALGLLALIIRDAPHAVAIEREQFATLLATGIASIKASVKTTQVYHKQLDDRLSRLPAEIENGISPPAIAHAIIESVRQQFVQSGLPDTANALAAVAQQLNQATTSFRRAADQLGAYNGVANQARDVIDRMTESLTRAAESTRWAAEDVAKHFRFEYRRFVMLFCAIAFALGALAELALQHWIDSRAAPAPQPVIQTIQAPVPPSPRQVEPTKRAPEHAGTGHQ